MDIAFKVVGNQGVRNLPNKRVANPWLVYEKACNTFLPIPTPIIESNNIFYDDCDKNFVYYTLIPRFYPKLQKVYLNSQPGVLWRFKNSHVQIYLTTNFHQYKKRWAKDMDNVKLINKDEFRELIVIFYFYK
jgi:hypothetical protein